MNVPENPILVIGDFCTDVALYAATGRVSRERPVPVLDLEDIAAAGGCASNVVRQLRAYGADVRQVALAETTKVRGLAGLPEQEVFRLDSGWTAANDETVAASLAGLADVAFSAVVYVDYRGLAGPPPAVRDFLAMLPCPKVADARRSLQGWDGFSVLKMNATDAGLQDEPTYSCDVPVLVLTRGAAGHIIAGPRDYWRESACPLPGPVLNVSGAGDVFTATLAVLLADTKPTPELVHEASKTAALAAGLRIRKAGYNETVTWEEIETCKNLKT